MEGDILQKLRHPNIIHVREVQTDNNYLYIVMDYADGGDLSMKIKAQNGVLFDENTILDWFTQVCLAIKHIHDRKILHRDIKSQNIFLMKNGQVKLGDFGIAKCLDQTIDKAKTYVGTPYYLSPEIINSQPYGFQSDIWSLGVLLYEMCALKMPFDASNLPQLYIKIINCNYQPLNNKYSNELKKLVKDMLNEVSLKRPTISQILDNPIIRPRIKNFLSEEDYNVEFSHTILHNFKLDKSDEKMTKNELISYNNNINNNMNINNFMNNVRNSQGHSRPIIIKNERNLRDSKNYHYQQQKEKEKEQNRINMLKKNLEGKPNNINNRLNRPGIGKYNGNNLYNYNYGGNNNINNNNYNNNISRGFYLINEGKDYKKNDSGRNKKNKNMGKEEFSSDKIGKNNQNRIYNNNNNNNNINNNEMYYNGLRSENSAKYNNSNKKKMDYEKKNSNLNNNNVNNINNINNYLSNNNSNSQREKDKERKQKIGEMKRKFKRENKNNNVSNSNGVIWMRGMEKYMEKKDDTTTTKMTTNAINNSETSNIRANNNNISNNIINDLNDNNRMKYDDLIMNSNKKEINGKNLLPLNNISNTNNNDMNNSNDSFNDEEIYNNNKLYKDMLKGNNLNFNENNNNNSFNGIQNSNINNNNNQDLLLGNLSDEISNDNDSEINDKKITEDICNDIFNDFGKDLTINISNIIRKYVNDDMLTYDYDKIRDNICKDLKNKNISQSIIERAIIKIPDIYSLFLSNKLEF